MSYLNTPRICFAGRFYTDPSTVNNDPKHYDPDCTRPSPWQEPKGKHDFQLVDCTVRSALGPAGEAVTDDPLLGAEVTSKNLPSAKIVDLDVYQQGVSTIYGLQIRIPVGQDQALVGDVVPATLNGVWFQRVLPTRGWNLDYGQGSYGGDANAAGSFQTQMRVQAKDWPSGSPLLDELRAATITDKDGAILVSLKFVLDGYQNVATDSGFRHGRLTGSIGPVLPGEPAQAPAARWLVARPLPKDAAWFVPNLYSGPFLVDERRAMLVIDLANCLCMETVGGAPVDLGTLQAQVGSLVIGAVNYTQFAYDSSAGIAELPLGKEHLSALSSQPLELVTSRQDIGPPVLFAEDPAGLSWAVDGRMFRMTSEPDSASRTAETQVYVRRWGKPVPGMQLQVNVVPVEGDTPGNTGTPGSPGDTPAADGALTASITPTDDRGVATVHMSVVKDPGSRTPELDGQLYFLYPYEKTPPTSAPQEIQISVLAWSQYPVNTNPSWDEVKRLLWPYVKLYPSMTDIINLVDSTSFDIFSNNPPWSKAYGCPPDYNVMGISAGAIPYYMTRDFTDPRFMPISRDLSPNRITTILHYIKNHQPKPSATPTANNTTTGTRG